MLLSAARQSLRQQQRVAQLPLRAYATNKGPTRPAQPTPPAAAPAPLTEKSPLPADSPLASDAAPTPTEAEILAGPAPTPTPTAEAPAPAPAAPTQENALSTRANSLAEQFMDLSEVAPEGSSSSSGNTFPGERTGARAKGSGSSSIEKKRKNLTRGLLLAGLLGTVGTAGWLGREWESEEEKMKMIGRSEDLQAVRECDEGGWQSFLGRAKIRGADYLDVSSSRE